MCVCMCAFRQTRKLNGNEMFNISNITLWEKHNKKKIAFIYFSIIGYSTSYPEHTYILDIGKPHTLYICFISKCTLVCFVVYDALMT